MTECNFCKNNHERDKKKCYSKDTVCKNFKACKRVINIVKKEMERV